MVFFCKRFFADDDDIDAQVPIAIDKRKTAARNYEEQQHKTNTISKKGTADPSSEINNTSCVEQKLLIQEDSRTTWKGLLIFVKKKLKPQKMIEEDHLEVSDANDQSSVAVVKIGCKSTDATGRVPVNSRGKKVMIIRPPSLLGDQENEACYWHDTIPNRDEQHYRATNLNSGFHLLVRYDEPDITEMFSNENANACSIM